MPSVTSTPSRIGLWSALSLAVPAVLAAAWAFLEPGGLVARAVENERRTAERAVNAATETFTMSMRQRARETPIALELDAARTVVGPFAHAAAAETAAEPSLAERTAIARFAAGDRNGAIEFFAHAKKAGELSRLGLLQYGNALASADARAALALLGEEKAGFANARCGPLPFAALRLAAEVRWSHAANAPLRDGHRDAALAALRITPSSHVEAVVAELGLDEPTTRAVVAAAKAASALRARRSEVPSSAYRDPNLGLLVPIDELRLAVLDEHAIESLRAQAFAAARAAEPDLELVLGDASSSTATAHVTGLDEIWTAKATSMRTSAVLRVAARASLVLSLVTLVLGNLLVWRTNRREAQLVALRSDFVDVVSHELRTPLAAMSLKSEMLANGDVPEERRAHYLQAMHQDVLRLTDQVERVLDFGRLQKGKELRIAPTKSRELLAKALRSGRPALRLAQQRVELEVPRDLPALACDVDVLARALKNLLENAAKYAPPGSTVAVRAFAQRDEVVVEVADRGPGVPQGERKSIFEPFVRGSTAGPGTPGSGLGLALVQAAVKRHGGTVEVHDRPGGGALFTVTLPQAEAS